jgi:hypothetical protein
MTDVQVDDAELSPLIEIERLTLKITNERSLSPGRAEAEGQLRAIVVELVEEWRADFRRGLRPVDLYEPQSVVERAMSNLTGYGPLTTLLDDDDVWEIMLNAPEEELSDAWGRDDLTDAEVATYWRTLIAQNMDQLVDPGNPDLLFPGQELTLPNVPPAPG